MSLKFNVTLDRDEDGAWVVECPAIRMRRFAPSFLAALLLIVMASAASSSAAGNTRVGPKRRPVPTAQERHRLDVLVLAAVSRNDYARFRALLAQGADPNLRQYREGRPRTPENSHTWLMEFSALGEASTVKALLERGARVNARGWTCFSAMGHGEPDPRGSTALIDACCRDGNEDVIRLLLQHGADVNARDRSGNTPLGVTVWQAMWDECDLLLRHGARPSLLHSWERESLARHLRRR